MNIFITHTNPSEAANYLWKLDRRRANKMMVEGMQMVSTVSRLMNLPNEYIPLKRDGHLYKITHRNHPMVKWVMSSQANFNWLVRYLDRLRELCGGEHASVSIYNMAVAMRVSVFLPAKPFTGFINHAKSREKGLDFSSIRPVTKAYRMYLQVQQ